MRITRSRRFTVNMGEYESYQFGGEVSCDHHDLGYTDEELAEIEEPADYDRVKDDLHQLVMTTLNDVVLDDVREAGTLTPNKRSYILRAMGVEEKPLRRRRRGDYDYA